MMRYFIYFFLGLSLLSCNLEEKVDEKITVEVTNKYIESGDQVELKYTQMFSIYKYETYTSIMLKNPWEFDEVFAHYILVSATGKEPDSLPKNSIVVHTPVNSVVAVDSPHIGVLNELSSIDKITGVGYANYIYNEKVRSKIESGEIKSVGNEQTINVEQIVELAPELVIATGNQQINNSLEQISAFGIPVMYVMEWMDLNPLARAEWIKIVGAFLDKEQEADSIFNRIEQSYLQMAAKANYIEEKPDVLLGNVYGGSWYMAAGGSYFAHFLKDAGASYYWFADSSAGSLALSFEEVVDKQLNADFWLNPGMSTDLNELQAEEGRYISFKAFKNKNVYNAIKRQNEVGANDYFESSTMKPHLVLADIIKILHPELLPDHELVFYQKLSN